MLDQFSQSARFGVLFAVLLLGSALFTGCTDSFTGAEDTEHFDAPAPMQARYDGPKFRNSHLMDQAIRIEATGKSESSYFLNLIIKIAQHVLDKQGVMSRYKIMDRFKISQRYQYDDAFDGFAWAIQDSTGGTDYQDVLDSLDADPDIEWYEPDFQVESPPVTAAAGANGQQVPWSVSAVGGRTSWTVSGNGSGSVGVDVYVIDTGVAQADPNDPNDDLDLVENIDFRDGFNDAADYDGHGTHIAGIIGAVDDNDGLVGLAPGARIHNMKVLGDDGLGDVSVAMAAVEYIMAQKLANPNTPMVVNLSLGDDVVTTNYTVLDQAIQASVAAGVVYVIAAGNHGTQVSSVTPAHVTEAITVGAYDASGHFASFSNYGSVVDILAPGESVVSLSPSGTPVQLTGTSMAAAHVTGAAALYLAQNPSASPAQVAQALKASAGSFVTGAPATTTNKNVWVGQSPMVSSTFEKRVGATYDDAEEYASTGYMYGNSTDLELADDFDHAGTTQHIGIRFSGVAIPPGATITNAYVQFTVDEASSGASNLTIHGQDADDALSFNPTTYNITSRAATTATVGWTPPDWNSVGAAGADQRTPDLSSVLQEIVNRPGWSSCNAMALVVSGTGQRTAESYEGYSSKAPLLHVEWSGGSTGACGGTPPGGDEEGDDDDGDNDDDD